MAVLSLQAEFPGEVEGMAPDLIMKLSVPFPVDPLIPLLKVLSLTSTDLFDAQHARVPEAPWVLLNDISL